ncbi:MAG TPA: zf-HC2 domain-containing protein [Bryobacteraceae bacterium]|nr:zf-HC2 domain-containing protein [Bryobacteraceae bacterium]
MQHQDAVDSRALERYLLGELPEAERQAFEQHYFDCPECAAGVEAGAILAANAATAFPEPRRAGTRSWRLAFWPAFAFGATLSLLILGWEEFIRIPEMKAHFATLIAPRAYPVTFLRSVTRSADQTVTIGKDVTQFGLTFDLPPGDAATVWNCRLDDASGVTKWRVQARTPAVPGEPLNLLIPASLAPGRYVLVLSPADGQAEHRFPLEVRFPFELRFH